MSDLSKKIKRKLETYKPRSAIQPARIGLDDGTVAVEGEKYMIWVKLFDGQTLKVLNQRVSSKFGRMVQIGYDEVQFPSRLQVLGMWDVYPEAQWGGTPNHADQHQWMGDDPVFLGREQFTPGLVLPVSGALQVDIYPFSCLVSGTTWYVQSDIERVDISASVPTSAGFRYGLLVLDTSSLFVVRDGTIVATRMELENSLIPLPTTGDKPLAALILYYGQTELIKEDQDNDIVDLRFFG